MGSEEVNWSLCCLCQINGGGEIRCPAKSKRKDRGAGYKSLSNMLSQFKGSMNIPESLSNDTNLEQTLMTNHAKFHKSCFNKLIRKGKQPYDAEEPGHASPAKTRKLSRCSTGDSGGGICLFCGVDDYESVMHSVSSTECDLNVRAWATNLDDFDMLGKLANGDLFAHDAVYHKECMTRCYTRHRSRLHKKRSEGKISQSELEGIALAETVAYVTESDSDGPFYIVELAELYKTRLKELGGIVPDRVHTPRFQERILLQIPWMKGLKADKKLYIAEDVARSIMCAHEEGRKKHSAFVKERLETQAVAFHEPIKKNKILLPSNRHKKQRNKRVDSTKDDLHLLGQLYISLQVREGSADRLFELISHHHGNLRSGQKSDLVPCLEADSPSDFNGADVKLIDGASMVHFLKPDGSIKTICEKKVIPFTEKQLATAKRIDVIWDRYISDSLKATTRESRGAGVRQRLPSDGNGQLST